MIYRGTFAPPGPGSWELESTHMPRPLSRWLAPIYGPAYMRGFMEATSRYGLLFSHIDAAFVNGFLYGRVRIVGAPAGSTGHPPKPVMKILLAVHPEIRARRKRVREMFASKLWRDDVKRWDAEWKPALAQRNRALRSVPVGALDDAALARHLDELRAAVAHAIYRHHSLSMCNFVPIGDFLAHAKEWTGRTSSELMRLLSGASAVSAHPPEAERVRSAVASSARAQSALAQQDAAAIVATLCELDDTKDVLRAYLETVGDRTLGGYDVADKTIAEVPELIVEAIRPAGDELRPYGTRPPPSTHEEITARIRDAVPQAHRQTFDELLAEARLTIRVRDERGYDNDAWTVGIARCALLEAGRRLARRGALEDAEHAVDLAPEEITAMLAGAKGPPPAEIAAVAAYRQTKTYRDAPPILGAAPGKRPPTSWFDEHTARSLRAIEAMVSAMFDTAEPDASVHQVVRGLPASPGRVEGTARVVLDPSGFARVKQGDVLIARMTSPTYNVLLPIVAGIVTDRGGLLSHAAIVARESGMPAVVGTREATRVIPDGARVSVDGDTGEVRVL